ncbi:MAG TPA: hypothetical protein PK876_00290 [Elusimicrobiota bacterium]|nr:hypothetical protein [Elusimicrobiota bacterium]
MNPPDNADIHFEAFDVKKVFEGASAYLEEKGLGRLFPMAQQYCPDRVREAEKILDRFDELAVKHKQGECSAYSPTALTLPPGEAEIPSPCGTILKWYLLWLDILDEVRPLAERRVA